jgi:hypothetical protein
MGFRVQLYVDALQYQEIEKNKMTKFLYSEKIVPLLQPVLFVLYNGKKTLPDISNLSMSYCFKREDSSIINSNELTVTIYNINFGHNQELMERMPEIYEYSYFVDKTRKYEKKGFSRDEVIKRSVSDCIANNIMVKYLEKNYNKVANMYTMSEDYEDYLIYQGEKKGHRKGVKKGVEMGVKKGVEMGVKKGVEMGKDELSLQIVKKMLANGLTPSFISKNTGIPLVEVKKLKEKVL